MHCNDFLIFRQNHVQRADCHLPLRYIACLWYCGQIAFRSCFIAWKRRIRSRTFLCSRRRRRKSSFRPAASVCRIRRKISRCWPRRTSMSILQPAAVVAVEAFRIPRRICLYCPHDRTNSSNLSGRRRVAIEPAPQVAAAVVAAVAGIAVAVP